MLFEFHSAQTEEHLEAPYISSTPYLYNAMMGDIVGGCCAIFAFILIIAPSLYEVIKNAR